MKSKLNSLRRAVGKLGEKLAALNQPSNVVAGEKMKDKESLTLGEKKEITQTIKEVFKDLGSEARSSSYIASFFKEKIEKIEGLHPVLKQAFDDVAFAFGEHMLYGVKKDDTDPEEVARYLKGRLLPEKFDF